MSYQTREQSIGYILKATLEIGSNRSELREVYLGVKQGIKNLLEEIEDDKLDNNMTCNILYRVLGILEKEDDYIKKAVSALYYAYDVYTVEEAEKFYGAFKEILRIK